MRQRGEKKEENKLMVDQIKLYVYGIVISIE